MLRLLLLLALAIPAYARDAAQVRAFKRETPCPSTGERKGSCPGYQVDHRIALACGGRDALENLRWLTIEEHREKTRRDAVCWKRKPPDLGVSPL
jgi:5-methylcytosine-specific restriction endonuclease McrA